MRIFISAALIAVAPIMAFASGADGVWKTEPGDSGGYLEVTVSPCGSNTCGTITKAYSSDGSVDTGYANLGKPIIKGMVSNGTNSYDSGTIWDPEANKTYKSKMKVEGSTLVVKGCIGPICSGQKWSRIK